MVSKFPHKYGHSKESADYNPYYSSETGMSHHHSSLEPKGSLHQAQKQSQMQVQTLRLKSQMEEVQQRFLQAVSRLAYEPDPRKQASLEKKVFFQHNCSIGVFGDLAEGGKDAYEYIKVLVEQIPQDNPYCQKYYKMMMQSYKKKQPAMEFLYPPTSTATLAPTEEEVNDVLTGISRGKYREELRQEFFDQYKGTTLAEFNAWYSELERKGQVELAYKHGLH
jgi:hypothetical protein